MLPRINSGGMRDRVTATTFGHCGKMQSVELKWLARPTRHKGRVGQGASGGQISLIRIHDFKSSDLVRALCIIKKIV